jgi:DNA mismatch endonuclease (patch repair protein)
MTDVHSKETRSYNMSRIRGKDTGPEMVVRRFLFSHGIRYRLHYKKLPGKPDIVLKKYNTIVDIRGCFWHGHKDCKFGDNIKTQSVRLAEKVKSAIERDKRNEENWKVLGWNVIIVWDSCELEIKKKRSEKREIVLKNILQKLLKRK